MKVDNSEDRRVFQRFPAPEEAIIVDDGNIFRLLDVSKGGLSFRCPEEESLPDNLSVTIFYSNFAFRLKNVSMEIVWEKPNNLPSFLSAPTKEVGVKFDKLNDYHKGQLDIFLTDIRLAES